MEIHLKLPDEWTKLPPHFWKRWLATMGAFGLAYLAALWLVGGW